MILPSIPGNGMARLSLPPARLRLCGARCKRKPRRVQSPYLHEASHRCNFSSGICRCVRRWNAHQTLRRCADNEAAICSMTAWRPSRTQTTPGKQTEMQELKLRYGLFRLSLVLLLGFCGLVGIIYIAILLRAFGGFGIGFTWVALSALPFWLSLMAGLLWSLGERPSEVFWEEWEEIKQFW